MQVHERDVMAVLLLISISIIYYRSHVRYPFLTLPVGLLLTFLLNILITPTRRP